MAKENETIPPTITDFPAATKTGQSSNNAAAPLPISAPVTFVKPFPDISKIEVFDGNNFRRWMERVYSTLDMNGMVFALTDAKPTDDSLFDQWTHANKVCRHTIISTLSNELFDVYSPYKEAKQIWDSMITKYTAEDVGKQKFVIGNFYRWEMTDGKDIKGQINEYHKLVDDLKAENIELLEEFVAGILIEKLSESWNDYKQQLKHKQKQLSLTDLNVHIIVEATTRKEIQANKAKEITTKANLVQHQQPRYKNKKPDFKPKMTNPTFKKQNTCFVCGKPGHYAAQCRNRKMGNDRPARPRVNLVEADEPDDIIAAVISQANIMANLKEWIVDSGATRHICANRDAFTSYTTVGEGEETIYLGDSRAAQVQGKGKVLLKLTSGKTLALQDVLHVPNIRANLISVSLLGKVGVKVSFESDKIVMTKNNVLVGKGYCNQGLFVLNIVNVIMNGNASSSAYMVDSMELWHARLGHVSISYIKKMQSLGLISNIDEAFDMFLKYKAEVENQLNKKIKRVRSDRGGEYVLLNNYYEKEGIIHEVTPPYSPESNGVAERKNRTLKEMMNAMLVSSNAHDNLWGKALLSTCHVQNRIPYKKTSKTPYEIWKGYAPNLKNLKVWGCLAKELLPDIKKRKVGSKTSNCLFIGYAEHSAAYRFLVLKSDAIECNTIVETKNVEFFEQIFPLRTDTISHAPFHRDDLTVVNDDLRQSKRPRKESSFGNDFYTYVVDNDPVTFSEAISSKESCFWKNAIKSEIDSILQNQTWELVNLPPGAKSIGCKWIFKRKFNPNGSVDKYKARLVAKGFTQKENIDYFDTFAPVTRISSIRVLIALASIYKPVIHQMDVKTAFLNGDLEDEIYMMQQKVVLFRVKRTSLYVDDMLIFGTCIDVVNETKRFLTSKFDMKDMGEANVILGVKIIRCDGSLMLTQEHYVERLLKRFGHFDVKPMSTPYDTTTHLKKKSRRQCVSTKLCSDNWESDALDELHKTGYCICGYSDANWISDSDETKSTSGYVFTFGGGAIAWKSTK
ncbi:Integrase, catalytic core [Corchorus capsularis]|uniref:Integrase, catalytic core n=1 Tax=Corchorus capsularis TaxID=210143 RepID=A0A1R3J4N4_COCAP|nr:Integrase, catalytic core [Corchorus capsularis]